MKIRAFLSLGTVTADSHEGPSFGTNIALIRSVKLPITSIDNYLDIIELYGEDASGHSLALGVRNIEYNKSSNAASFEIYWLGNMFNPTIYDVKVYYWADGDEIPYYINGMSVFEKYITVGELIGDENHSKISDISTNYTLDFKTIGYNIPYIDNKYSRLISTNGRTADLWGCGVSSGTYAITGYKVNNNSIYGLPSFDYSAPVPVDAPSGYNDDLIDKLCLGLKTWASTETTIKLSWRNGVCLNDSRQSFTESYGVFILMQAAGGGGGYTKNTANVFGFGSGGGSGASALVYVNIYKLDELYPGSYVSIYNGACGHGSDTAQDTPTKGESSKLLIKNSSDQILYELELKGGEPGVNGDPMHEHDGGAGGQWSINVNNLSTDEYHKIISILTIFNGKQGGQGGYWRSNAVYIKNSRGTCFASTDKWLFNFFIVNPNSVVHTVQGSIKAGMSANESYPSSVTYLSGWCIPSGGAAPLSMDTLTDPDSVQFYGYGNGGNSGFILYNELIPAGLDGGESISVIFVDQNWVEENS